MGEKCPGCGTEAHPDSVRRAAVYGSLRYPCGSVSYREDVRRGASLVDHKAGDFDESYKCRDRRLAQEREAREKAEEERDKWRNLVAVLCGDGGHYHQEHGTKATVEHCKERFFALMERAEKAEAACAAMREFIAAELQWQDFRSEMMEHDFGGTGPTARNARKLQEYLRGLDGGIPGQRLLDELERLRELADAAHRYAVCAASGVHELKAGAWGPFAKAVNEYAERIRAAEAAKEMGDDPVQTD